MNGPERAPGSPAGFPLPPYRPHPSRSARAHLAARLPAFLLPASFLLVALLLSPGCRKPEPTVVRIAVAEPLTLPTSTNRIQAVQMALKEEGFRAGGWRVELKILDTSGAEGQPLSPNAELRAAQKAIDDPAVVGYIGSSYTSLARASMPVLNRAGLVQLSPTASWPGLTKTGFGAGEPGIYYPSGERHFFRLVPSDDFVGVAAAHWARHLGFSTVYVIDNGLAYGRGIAGIFDLTARDLGLTILAHESLDLTTEPDVEAIVTRTLAAGPDLVFFGGTAPEGGDHLIPALRARDLHLQIMGPQELVTISADEPKKLALLEGIFATAPSTFTYPGAPAAARTFLDRYEATYGNQPRFGAIRSYEAAKVVLQALAHAPEPTREGVLQAMRNLGEFHGALGTWHFDDNGDLSAKDIDCVRLEAGSWVWVQTIHP